MADLLNMLGNYDVDGLKEKWDALYMIIKDQPKYYMIKDVELGIMDIYKGDAYGLMRHLGIRQDAFYITMLLNGMKTPTELDIKHKQFKFLTDETFNGMIYIIEND